MTAGTRRCVYKHAKAGHRDFRHACDAFLCPCERFVARDDTEAILGMLETIDGKATA